MGTGRFEFACPSDLGWFGNHIIEAELHMTANDHETPPATSGATSAWIVRCWQADVAPLTGAVKSTLMQSRVVFGVLRSLASADSRKPGDGRRLTSALAWLALAPIVGAWRETERRHDELTRR